MVVEAMLDGKVRDALIVLVAVGWLASIIGSIVNPTYTPDPSINGAFGLVIGAALAVGKKDGNDKGNDDERKARR